MTLSLQEAVLRIRDGEDASKVTLEALTVSESLFPRVTKGVLPGLLAVGAGGVALWKLFKSLTSTNSPDATSRFLNTFLGGAVHAGSQILSHKITGATINALGGQKAFSGHGDKVVYRIGMNAPTPNLSTTTTTGHGGYGGLSTTTHTAPAFEQQHLGRIESGKSGDSYYVNLYREDPNTGETIGAPVKTVNISFTGSTPASIENLQNGLARTIASLGDALITGRSMSRPPIVVQRRPGRPAFKAYSGAHPVVHPADAFGGEE